MDLDIIVLNEVSQTEGDKYHDTAYIRSLEKWYKWSYLQNRNRLSNWKQTDSYQRGGRGIREEFGIWGGLKYTYYYI